jgi:hypothetical protein
MLTLLIIAQHVSGQPPRGQCYFSTKGAFKPTSRLIILPIQGDKYIVEFYQYGFGIFWGLPNRDTLKYENGFFLSETNQIGIKAKKLRITSNESKRTFKFSVKDQCDTEVNWTRNWSLKEVERYKIKNDTTQQAFSQRTVPFLRTLCHDDFTRHVTQIKKEIGITN